MNIVVFGSCGFIGNALVRYYKNAGSNNRVFGVDILEKEEPDYFCLKKDESSFQDILDQSAPDVLINAAGAANVNLSFREPEWDYASNTLMVFRLLNAIRQVKPGARFIQLSSAAVYGNPLKLPVTECEPVKPMSPYGFHKWQSELICREFTEVYKLSTSIIRVFSAYGIGLRKQLFWDLYQKTFQPDEISMFGTGDESRDFIYIDDLVHAIDCVVQNGEFNAAIYNIANGEEVIIKDAVACFLKEMNWQGQLRFSGGNRSGDPLNWKADISKLSALGYRRKVNFSTGIKMYCKWLNESK